MSVQTARNDTTSTTMTAWRAGRPLLIVMAVALVLFVVTGRLMPVVTKDTAGYLVTGSLTEVLGAPRNPMFSWVLDVITLGIPGYATVPLLQTGFFLLAIWLWFRACMHAGLGRHASLALSLPLVPSNLLLLWNNAVHPEVLAASCVLIALSALLNLLTVRRSQQALGLLQLMLSLGMAYLLRPGNIVLVATLPILLTLLSQHKLGHWNKRLMASTFVACLLPFLLFSTLRLVAVGDFNTVSFGGFTMSGMAAQMLDIETVDKLPVEQQELARNIIRGKEELVAAGEAQPIPVNSSGRRDYLSMTLGYFDIVARNFDTVLFKVVLRQRLPTESWVDFNRRLQRYALATFLAVPERYAAWVVGGSARAVGRLLTTNLPFVAAVLCLVVLYPVWLARRSRDDLASGSPIHSVDTDDFHALLLIVVLYTASGLAPSVMLTFPAARYIDTTGLLIASIPAYALIRTIRALRP